MSERTAVYRFYGEGDVLLYIGATGNFERRRKAHSYTAVWWGNVVRHEVEWHNTQIDALVAEAKQIRELRPLHNVMSPSPDDPARLLKAMKGGRPATGQIPSQHTRIEQTDWDDLKAVVGSRERGQIVRDLIAWYLRRPGAKLPDRPSQARIAEATQARLRTPA